MDNCATRNMRPEIDGMSACSYEMWRQNVYDKDQHVKKKTFFLLLLDSDRLLQTSYMHEYKLVSK